VKADINREMELEELRKLQRDVQARRAISSTRESGARGRDGREGRRVGTQPPRCALRCRPSCRCLRSPSRGACVRTPRQACCRFDAADAREFRDDDTPTDGLQETSSRIWSSCDRGSALVVAIMIALVVLFPWAKEIYALLAAPLLKVLPHGSSMIATDVTGTFSSRSSHADGGVHDHAAVRALADVGISSAPGLYQHEKKLAAR